MSLDASCWLYLQLVFLRRRCCHLAWRGSFSCCVFAYVSTWCHLDWDISRDSISRAALVDKLIVAGIGWEKGTLVCIVARNAVLVMNICCLFAL